MKVGKYRPKAIWRRKRGKDCLPSAIPGLPIHNWFCKEAKDKREEMGWKERQRDAPAACFLIGIKRQEFKTAQRRIRILSPLFLLPCKPQNLTFQGFLILSFVLFTSSVSWCMCVHVYTCVCMRAVLCLLFLCEWRIFYLILMKEGVTKLNYIYIVKI